MRRREGTIIIEGEQGRCFCLEECDAYRKVKGRSVKVVDFGWVMSDSLYIAEIKDFGPSNRGSFSDVQNALEESLQKKVRDTLFMIAAVWADTEWGRKLYADIRDTCEVFPKEPCTIRPYVFIRLESMTANPLLDPLTDTLRAELAGVADMFDVRDIQVLPVDYRLNRRLDVRVTVDDP